MNLVTLSILSSQMKSRHSLTMSLMEAKRSSSFAQLLYTSLLFFFFFFHLTYFSSILIHRKQNLNPAHPSFKQISKIIQYICHIKPKLLQRRCVCAHVRACMHAHVHTWANFETYLFLSRSHLNHLRNFQPISMVRNDNNT